MLRQSWTAMSECSLRVTSTGTTYPPEAPVTRASLPSILLSTVMFSDDGESHCDNQRFLFINRTPRLSQHRLLLRICRIETKYDRTPHIKKLGKMRSEQG